MHDDAMGEAAFTDTAVLARMRAAVLVLQQAGHEVDTAEDRDSHLRRAVQWQRFSRGPVSPRHRACAVDVVRGSLRLWSAAGGLPPQHLLGKHSSGQHLPAGVPRSLVRVRLSTLVRTRCASLRTDLAAEAARLTRRGVVGYEERVRREVLRVWLEVEAAAAEYGLEGDSLPRREVDGLLPPRRRPRLENHLTVLLGAGFGTGLSLTVGRLAAALFPGWIPAVVAGCAALGLVLTIWTVLARRLLAERNAAERWMLEVVANLRPALEERVLTRILVAESPTREVHPSR